MPRPAPDPSRAPPFSPISSSCGAVSPTPPCAGSRARRHPRGGRPAGLTFGRSITTGLRTSRLHFPRFSAGFRPAPVFLTRHADNQYPLNQYRIEVYGTSAMRACRTHCAVGRLRGLRGRGILGGRAHRSATPRMCRLCLPTTTIEKGITRDAALPQVTGRCAASWGSTTGSSKPPARRLSPPAKDSSGDYIWTDDDLARAREAFARRKKRTVAAK